MQFYVFVARVSNMLVLKELILFVATTVFTMSAYAEHKRVIINVPQRTRHIYHHHVKKVPVYVLLPSKKPKILDDLDLHQPKPTKPTPCKDYEYHGENSQWQEDREDGRYRYAARYNDRGSERDSYLPEWAEDRDNKGAIVSAPENFRNIDHEVPPPLPVTIDDDLPFRRTTNQVDEQPRVYPNNRQIRNEVSSTRKTPSLSVHHKKLAPVHHRQISHQNEIRTYPSSAFDEDGNSGAAQSSSYQYRIGHRASYDNLVAED